MGRPLCSTPSAKFLSEYVTPFDRYSLEFEEFEMLGSGGFGTVYRCKHRLLQQEYAIKKVLVSSGEKEEMILRDLREVRELAKLHHPNIIKFCACWLQEIQSDWDNFDLNELDVDSMGSPSSMNSVGMQYKSRSRSRSDAAGGTMSGSDGGGGDVGRKRAGSAASGNNSSRPGDSDEDSVSGAGDREEEVSVSGRGDSVSGRGAFMSMSVSASGAWNESAWDALPALPDSSEEENDEDRVPEKGADNEDGGGAAPKKQDRVVALKRGNSGKRPRGKPANRARGVRRGLLTYDHCLFIQMELCRSGTLANHLAKEERVIDMAEVLGMLAQVRSVKASSFSCMFSAYCFDS
jgi:serine/threonine protein kinase